MADNTLIIGLKTTFQKERFSRYFHLILFLFLNTIILMLFHSITPNTNY